MKHPRLTGVIAPLAALTAIAGLAPSALGQSFHLMGFVPPRVGSFVYGLSADGTVAAGFDGGAGSKAFTWTAAGGRNNFGMPFIPTTEAFGISGDGFSVVGAGGSGPVNAFRWSQAGGGS